MLYPRGARIISRAGWWCRLPMLLLLSQHRTIEDRLERVIPDPSRLPTLQWCCLPPLPFHWPPLLHSHHLHLQRAGTAAPSLPTQPSSMIYSPAIYPSLASSSSSSKHTHRQQEHTPTARPQNSKIPLSKSNWMLRWTWAQRCSSMNWETRSSTKRQKNTKMCWWQETSRQEDTTAPFATRHSIVPPHSEFTPIPIPARSLLSAKKRDVEGNSAYRATCVDISEFIDWEDQKSRRG